MNTDSQWTRIGRFPHHGICVPLFSLRTQNSSGIGEFLDLIPLIDWCKTISFDCIQLLPLCDSGMDPSPYNPISASALDPIYLSLKELGIDTTPFKSFQSSKKTLRDEVLPLKLDLLRKLFAKTFTDLAKTAAYQNFLSNNSWLKSYASFKALKTQFNHAHWKQFPPDAHPGQKEINFHNFLQFHAFRQMGIVRSYAEKEGVFLKGDIPILISPDSADVWATPSLFQLELSAGAPPDAYNRLGQNWGFPLFNWDEMKKDGFQWWKNRLKTAEQLYHIYRIDHVVGFFRIWGIQQGQKAIEGSFFPPDSTLWAGLGKERLEMMIGAAELLPMAEDLGVIPEEVYPILKELGICSTKVVRWQRKEGSYLPFNQYEPISMTTLSTPDMEPLELWWRKCPSESVPFAEFMEWAYHPILTAKQRLKILRDAHHTTSLFHINLLQEYLALFPELVSQNDEEERINVPGTLLSTNWTYRFKPSLEEIAAHKGLLESFQAILVPP